MNWLDLTIILILIISIFVGIKRGFIKEFLPFLSNILGFVIAIYYVEEAAQVTQKFVASEALAYVISFIVVFAIVKIMFLFIRRFFTKKLSTKKSNNFVNKWVGGTAFGFTRAAFIIFVFLFTLNILGKKDSIQNSKLSPFILGYIHPITSLMGGKIRSTFETNYEELREVASPADSLQTGESSKQD